MNTPVVLAYFSQSADPQDAYLQYLQDEFDAISSAWERYRITQSDAYLDVHFPARGNARTDRIKRDIQNYKHQLIIFHFSGHAGSEELIFRNGSAHAAGLAGLLGEARNLKMVFLNGCATQDQVKLLFENKVKAVVATRGKVADGLAKEFATIFYEAVSSTNYTVTGAFEHALNALKLEGRIAPATSSKYTTWRGLVTRTDTNQDQWELFVREGFEKELDKPDWWKIGIIAPSQKEVFTDGELTDHVLVVLVIILFLFGVGAMVYGIFYLEKLEVTLVGLASAIFSIFGIKNQQRYKVAEFNAELLGKHAPKGIGLFS